MYVRGPDIQKDGKQGNGPPNPMIMLRALRHWGATEPVSCTIPQIPSGHQAPPCCIYGFHPHGMLWGVTLLMIGHMDSKIKKMRFLQEKKMFETFQRGPEIITVKL
jgi:hypothetical protein